MNVKSLLKWFNSREGRQGGIRIIPRRNGDAVSYRWMIGRVPYSKNFAAGTSENFIKARIAEIESQLLDQKNGIGNGPEVQHRRRKRMTLRELTEWFIKIALDENNAIRTIESAEYSMRKFIAWIGDESFSANNVRRSQLDDFKRHLLQNNYSANGARVQLARIIRIFRKACYEEKLESFSFTGFQFPKSEEMRSRPILTLVEMRDIAELFRRERTRLAWNVARFVGLRGADIIKLQAENINHEKRIVKFWCSKLHRWEALPFHPKLAEILDPFRGKIGPLFSYKNDQALKNQFRDKILQFKGEDFRPAGSHTPRHSLGAYLRNEAKWQWADIQMFLCHRKASVTARYAHEDIEHLRTLIERLPLDGGA